MPLKFRSRPLMAAQLELSGQMETPDFICSFIDFIASYGFNTLALCLDGRLKTPSFPYPKDDESYSVSQVKAIIAYAARKHVNVLPILQTFGHCGWLLRHPELAHLAELRNSAKGRFTGGSSHVVCPSLPETMRFFTDYFQEAAEIFPGPYFHVGADEVWDIGFCPLCRARAEGAEGQAGIFAAHMLKVHELVVKKLKKKMIMWDDMFEYYPAALEQMPRDIIMCAWHYDALTTSRPRGHFFNQLRQDSLSWYDKLGFRYLVAPAEFCARNVETYRAYASVRKPLGLLLTAWGKSRLFYQENYPTTAYAGRLFSGDGRKAAGDVFAGCVKDIFGVGDKLFVDAVRSLKDLGRFPEYNRQTDFLRGPVGDSEYQAAGFFRLAGDGLNKFRNKIRGTLGRDIFQDMDLAVRRKLLQCALRSAVWNWHHGQDVKAVLGKCLEEAELIKRERLAQWKRYRSGIKSDHLADFYSGLARMIKELIARRPAAGLLHVYFCLPDAYSAQTTALFIRYQGGREWELLKQGTLKPLHLGDTFYQYSFPVDNKRKIDSVRIESWGYGGQGLTWLEAVNSAGRFRPQTIEKCEGLGSHPEHVLDEDRKWCFLGNPNTRRAFLDPALAGARHILQVALAKASDA